jgi:hypothetical protein
MNRYKKYLLICFFFCFSSLSIGAMNKAREIFFSTVTLLTGLPEVAKRRSKLHSMEKFFRQDNSKIKSDFQKHAIDCYTYLYLPHKRIEFVLPTDDEEKPDLNKICNDSRILINIHDTYYLGYDHLIISKIIECGSTLGAKLCLSGAFGLALSKGEVTNSTVGLALAGVTLGAFSRLLKLGEDSHIETLEGRIFNDVQRICPPESICHRAKFFEKKATREKEIKEDAIDQMYSLSHDNYWLRRESKSLKEQLENKKTEITGLRQGQRRWSRELEEDNQRLILEIRGLLNENHYLRARQTHVVRRNQDPRQVLTNGRGAAEQP